jgi:hypothetical protein
LGAGTDLEAWCGYGHTSLVQIFFKKIIIIFINTFTLFYMYIYANININISLKFIIDNYKSLGAYIGLSISANNSS